MTDPSAINQSEGLLLPGLDGTNPLGFLAALGVLQTLHNARGTSCKTAMRWNPHIGGWQPVVSGFTEADNRLGITIAEHLRCPYKPADAKENRRRKRESRFNTAKKELKDAQKKLKNRKLRGKELDAAKQHELKPRITRLERRRMSWLHRLQDTVPSRELALGKHLNADKDELREAILLNLKDASRSSREVVDLLTAFGSDVCTKENSKQMAATPFCFITGSGHQYFLDTVRQLTREIDGDQIQQVLLEGVNPRDEKFSMRWDPIEDRRYAQMWDDPTAPNNKATTNWVLNLLAYRGLQLLPSVPTSHGLKTTGWPNGDNTSWTWPIWSGSACPDVVRSLLSHPQLQEIDKSSTSVRSMGIAAVYRSRRIQVGEPPLCKINFTPAQRIA